MLDYSSDKYKRCREWIIEKKEKHYSWEDIKRCCADKSDVDSEFNHLKIPQMVVPLDMSYDEWLALIDEMQENYVEVSDSGVNGIYSNSGNVEYPVPSGKHDAWKQYEKLLKGELDGKRRMTNASVGDIEENSHWLLNRIRKETRECGPQKGLVMGSVQSGKTANMVGLVTMAAHYDWNFIIILSGTVDNLRVQTRNRFMKDLLRCQDADWHCLESTSNEDFLKDISAGKTISIREANFNFSEPHTIIRSPHHETYVMVCLKQASRLRKLIHWLHSDKNVASRLRLIVIDDEADQASINTAKMTDEEIKNRTVINQLIINLANGLDENGKPSNLQALNYIAYTATPYANVLNEAYYESLYPKDFVLCLPENNSYFGSKVIWGSRRDPNFPGLDIVRKIESKSNKTIKEIGKGNYHPFPDEFKDSVAWFLCCVAVLRVKKWKKPISMLIHTATGNQAHFYVYEALKMWLNDNRTNGVILKRCQSVYEKETNKFAYKQFEESYPLYEGMNEVDKTHLDFSEIRDELDSMLCIEPQTIEIEDNGEFKYAEDGIHICVDNCKAKKYANDDDTQLRIIYPDDEQLKSLNKAPAFIVIGGNTLSRGLTIEGLVSTFFSRSTNQADSLMQMARWYGYRKGYELLPRIWMTEESIDKYRLLEQVDEKLRKTLIEYKEMGKNPRKLVPPVMSTSSIAKFLLTSKNKSQRMVPCEMDYSGDSYELTEFSANNDELIENKRLTEEFLKGLGIPDDSSVYPGKSFVWRSVPSSEIIKFIKSFHIFSPCGFSSEISDFIPWMEKENDNGRYLLWNIGICGASTYKGDKWHLCDSMPELGKVERTRLDRVLSHIDIGSLRSGKDGICDIVIDENTDANLLNEGRKGINVEIVRGKLGYSDIPLLLIYCISNGGGKKSETKSPIQLDDDLIAYSVIIGGETSNIDHVQSVMVRVDDKEEDNADE